MSVSSVKTARSHRGAMAYFGGLSAETQVADLYRRQGRVIAVQRWRGRSGEIDLIAEEQGGFVFIEVKRAATHDRAVMRLSRRQRDRIYAAASEYISRSSQGMSCSVRFDVALVDQQGQIKIIENAFGLEYSGW